MPAGTSRTGRYDATTSCAIRSPRQTSNGARPTDLGLTLWHAPSEKRTGFRHLFDEVMRPGSAFWALAPGEAFRRHVGGFLGIPHASIGALAREFSEGDGSSLPVRRVA